MPHRLLLLLALLPSFASADRPLVVAYVPNWVDLKAFVPTIDFARLTHVNVAFENPTNDDGDLSFHPKDAILIDAARKANVKVLVSIGGGAASGDKKLLARYAKLLAEPNRAAFAAKLAAYVEAHNFDGLDVDIEGPAIIPDYGPFITELAKALHAKNKLITAALSKGYGGKNVPDSALRAFDLVHVMAYDGAGPWNRKSPGQHSSMQYTWDAVAYWLDRGLPKDRCVVGVPFYGYGFGDAFRNQAYGYAEIVAKYPGAESADQAGQTIYYNGLPTIRAKAAYVKEQGLAGVMIWSLDTDAPGDRSLLRALDQTLRPTPAGK